MCVTEVRIDNVAWKQVYVYRLSVLLQKSLESKIMREHAVIQALEGERRSAARFVQPKKYVRVNTKCYDSWPVEG